MLSSQILILAAALGASAGVVERQDDGRKHILNYLCVGDTSKGDMPEICKNMCYGVFCRNFPSSFYWDQKARDPKVARERSAAAGCGSGNRCGNAPYGNPDYQCDEFPFKSVQIDVDFPVNRCVPTSQNKGQSNVLKQFYASSGIYKGVGLDGKVGKFRLAFANYGGIQYCDADPDCTNDGNQWNRLGEVTGDPAKKRELTHETRAQRHYMTKRGQNIFVPDGADVGDIVWTPKSYSEDLEFDMDEIVGPANATVV